MKPKVSKKMKPRVSKKMKPRVSKKMKTAACETDDSPRVGDLYNIYINDNLVQAYIVTGPNVNGTFYIKAEEAEPGQFLDPNIDNNFDLTYHVKHDITKGPPELVENSSSTNLLSYNEAASCTVTKEQQELLGIISASQQELFNSNKSYQKFRLNVVNGVFTNKIRIVGENIMCPAQRVDELSICFIEETYQKSALDIYYALLSEFEDLSQTIIDSSFSNDEPFCFYRGMNIFLGEVVTSPYPFSATNSEYYAVKWNSNQFLEGSKIVQKILVPLKYLKYVVFLSQYNIQFRQLFSNIKHTSDSRFEQEIVLPPCRMELIASHEQNYSTAEKFAGLPDLGDPTVKSFVDEYLITDVFDTYEKRNNALQNNNLVTKI